MIAVTKMRKGHDFHKDKDVGELVKPWPMREKYPCVCFSLPYPTTFIEELLLVVEAVNFFGEWGGRIVSPQPHAHSTMVDFTMAGKNDCHHSRRDFSTLPTTVQKRSRTSNSRPWFLSVHPRAEVEVLIFMQGAIVYSFVFHAHTSFRFGLTQPRERSRFHHHSCFPPKGIDCVLTRSQNWVWISLTHYVFLCIWEFG